MNIDDVMQELATQLDTIDGLNTFAFLPDRLTPPTAFVNYPETLTFDETYGRGSDRLDLSVWVVVSRLTDEASWAELTPYAAGSGAQSVKAALEAGNYTSCDYVHVVSAEFDPVEIAGTVYRGASFTLDIMGSGA